MLRQWPGKTVVLAALLLAAVPQVRAQSVYVPNPVPSGGGRINPWDPSRGQGAGYYDAPRSGNRTHNGVDLAAPPGTPVQAVRDGVVIRSNADERNPYSTATTAPLPLNGAGNRVVVRHSDGTLGSYFHLNGQDQPQVGDRVVAGQVVGHTGTSGNVPPAADSHLHFELRNQQGVPVEPTFRQPAPSATPAAPAATPRPTAPVVPDAGVSIQFASYTPNRLAFQDSASLPASPPGSRPATAAARFRR